MNWSRPETMEVNMSAEIGAYQGDAGERDEAAADATLETDLQRAELGTIRRRYRVIREACGACHPAQRRTALLLG